MKATAYIREDIRWAHSLLELVMRDVTPELAAWDPPGLANPIGGTYAHAVCGEDIFIQQILQGGEPLLESSWKGRTGISEPQLASDFEWARRVQVDLPAARQYAQAVYAATDDYLATLADETLDQVLDLSAQGFEHKPVAWVLSALVISHLNNIAGEISALKGVQGVKGYPW